jgi:alkylation response protein AidB-like acyl-CoA dehydrogenase
MLRESLERYGRERYTFAQRRAFQAAPGGFSQEAWSDYAAMGWLAMPMAPQDGGFASDPQAIGALMQHVGHSLALEPVFASVVLCGRLFGLAQGDAVARDALQRMATGHAMFALAHGESDDEGMAAPVSARWRDGRLNGEKRIVLHGDCAHLLLVSARDGAGQLGLFLVDAAQAQVQRQAMRLVDGRGAAHCTFAGAQARPIALGADPQALLDLVLDDARLALCAEGLGAARALNALTLAYLKERRQFGRPIGSNQALQHRMVDLYMLEQEGRAVLHAAYRSVGAYRVAAICAAMAQVMTLGRQASHEAVQMHGGIGVTEDLAVSHYFRRIMVVNRLLGDRTTHVQRFAAHARV